VQGDVFGGFDGDLFALQLFATGVDDDLVVAGFEFGWGTVRSAFGDGVPGLVEYAVWVANVAAASERCSASPSPSLSKRPWNPGPASPLTFSITPPDAVVRRSGSGVVLVAFAGAG